MKNLSKYTQVALAVATFCASSVVMANGEPDPQDPGTKTSTATNTGSDVNTTESTVIINKELSYTQDVDVAGEIAVQGFINLNASSAAVVNNNQANNDNGFTDGANREATNAAIINGSALNGAAGNIGVNVSAGDNNQQANDAALSVADASFLFGSSDAELFGRQDVQYNSMKYKGNTNTAALTGSALNGAAGNIGVNITSGNTNQQINALAISTAVTNMSTATTRVNQVNDNNTTVNSPVLEENNVESVQVSLDFAATGQYAGIVDQMGNTYPDIWANDPGDNPVHPTDEPGPISHMDLDTVAQGASNRPVHSALDSEGQPTGPTSEGGALGFNEEGDIALAAAITGNLPLVIHQVFKPTTNTANLGDSALGGAAGNIGVNISAGTNNQQYNGLAMSVAHGGSGTTLPGGGEF